MSSFLALLADRITKNREIPLENTIIVVPNKRAKRVLFQELSLLFIKPAFAPNILSINEFMESLSPLQKIENDELLIRLFEVYKQKNGEVSDDFATFLTWAPLFLNDINEIDLHLIDAVEIFSNLSEIKTLETSFGKENLSETQKLYLRFYNQLADLYTDFTTLLRQENLGYEGMIYCDVACRIKHIEEFQEPAETSRYIFAGLNAATPSELEVLFFFFRHKNAEFYFDIDHFYNDKYGGFIKEIQQKLKLPEIIKSNHYQDIPKQVTCIGAPHRTAQVYQVIEILNTIEQQQGNLNSTVLVFADETMLIPFVHAYNCENANITMGFPLRATFAAQQLLQCIDTEKQNNRLQKPVYNLKTEGLQFFASLKNTFQKITDENTRLITSLLDDVSAFLNRFFANEKELNFSVVEYFLKEKLDATTIPFTGDVREGLQIMGLLETRLLDFKNVIVVSMNEGVLPKGKPAPSLLLYDIKKHFGLSTHQRKDAIIGYHFFRLLQRAETVFLIYDNDSSDSLAEKSRFIEQLEFEIRKQQLQENIYISHRQFVSPFLFPHNNSKICIIKTAPVIEQLKQFKYSTTSLSTYIQCSLKFYWRYIEKISAIRVFDESNESAIIGTVIHAVLEEIFTHLQSKPAQFSTILYEFEKNIDDMILSVFKQQQEIAHEDIFQGKLFLAYQIVKKSILDYITVIQNEWKSSVYQIIGTEIPLFVEVNVGENRLCFTGKTDRVEMRDNKVTILDYKTGKVDDKKLQCKIEDMETVFSDPDFQQLFQLLCYAYLYQNNNVCSLLKTAEIQCGIISFQELYKKNEQYIYYAEIDSDKILSEKYLQLFEGYLHQIFSSILDENTAFTQTNQEENCEYCEYRSICNR